MPSYPHLAVAWASNAFTIVTFCAPTKVERNYTYLWRSGNNNILWSIICALWRLHFDKIPTTLDNVIYCPGQQYIPTNSNQWLVNFGECFMPPHGFSTAYFKMGGNFYCYTDSNINKLYCYMTSVMLVIKIKIIDSPFTIQSCIWLD